MFKIAVFDVKEYDKEYFEKFKTDEIEFEYFEVKLTKKTKNLVRGFDAVCVFVNDAVDSEVIKVLEENKIKLILTRSAGFNQIDLPTATEAGIVVLRVPQYSPEAIAEYAVALLMALSRKIHLAYKRVESFNFNIVGLVGSNINTKTVGVVGLGKIGQCFAQIMKGFGARVIASSPMYDEAWVAEHNIEIVSQEELLTQSDIISLHCPLLDSTKHLINKESIAGMKKGTIIINTSRGGLIDTHALLEAIDNDQLKGAALDVYENEAKYFFEDYSKKVVDDENLKKLVKSEKVVISSHQAFLTEEALDEVYKTTVDNALAFIHNQELKNQV